MQLAAIGPNSEPNPGTNRWAAVLALCLCPLDLNGNWRLIFYVEKLKQGVGESWFLESLEVLFLILTLLD